MSLKVSSRLYTDPSIINIASNYTCNNDTLLDGFVNHVPQKQFDDILVQ